MSTLQVVNLQNPASGVINGVLNADGSTTIVLGSTGASRTGGIRYNAGTLEVYDGATWVAAGGLPVATLAEAAAGTLNTVVLTPETGVPKDASGMTGAAILPSGTTGDRPVAPAAGMTRVNTTTDAPEAYINGTWSPIQSTQSGQFAGFRNILINGNFSVNQRGYVSGTATTAANQYTLDRWNVVTSGQSVTFSASGNGNQVTAPAGGLEQLIEDVNVGGGVYTLSWTGTATATVNGTAVVNGGQVTLPADTQASVVFAGGTVSNAQLEPGGVATPFEQRTVGIELVLCQRYYQQQAMRITVPTTLTVAPNGQTYFIEVMSRPVNMRVSPTVTLPNGNVLSGINTYNNYTPTGGISTGYSSASSISILFNTPVGGTYSVTAFSDAEL